MRKFILPVFICLITCSLNGQKEFIDSLLQSISEAETKGDSFTLLQSHFYLWDRYLVQDKNKEAEEIKAFLDKEGPTYGFRIGDWNDTDDSVIEIYYPLQVLEEADPAWTYEEVKTKSFSPNNSWPNLSPDTVHWMRVKIRAPEDTAGTYLFRVGSRWRAWEKVDVFYEAQDSLVHQKFGYNPEKKLEKKFGFNNHFELNLAKEEELIVYVRVAGQTTISVPKQLTLYYQPGKNLEDFEAYSSDNSFPGRSSFIYRSYEISHHLELFMDSTGAYTLTEAKQAYKEHGAFPNGTQNFDRKAVYWGRLLLKGNDQFWGDQLFRIGYTGTFSWDKVDIFYQDQDGSLVEKNTGSNMPVFKRPLSHQLNFFELKVPPNDTLEVFFRFEQINRFFQSEIKRDLVFIGHINKDSIIKKLPIQVFRKGLLLGGLGLTFCYFFIFYLIEKNRIHLYFSLLVLGFFGVFFVFGLWTLDTGNADWGLIRYEFFVLFTLVFLKLFTVEYLNLKTLNIRLRSGLNITLIGIVIISVINQLELLSGSFPGNWVEQCKLALSLSFAILCILLGFIALRKGHKPAIFYLFAFLGFFLVYGLINLRLLVSPNTYSFLEEANGQLEIAVLAIPFFFALGMGYRSRLQQKEHEKALVAQTQALATAEAANEANEAKSTFLSTVSHELRTPLTSIIGFTKLNKKNLEEKVLPAIDPENPKAQKSANRISKNLDVVGSEGNRLLNLINELLDLAKIESGKVDWKMEEIQPTSLIERASQSTSALFAQKPQLDLITEVQESLPAFKGDPDRLLQVLINLISNAVKFTDRGKVTLKCELREGSALFDLDKTVSPFGGKALDSASGRKSEGQKGEEKRTLLQPPPPSPRQRGKVHLQFSVQDTGSGIPSDHLDKVFERFQQVDSAQDGKPKGTGLGLPICKEIVEHHGGEIWVESEMDKGSSFYFNLPMESRSIPGTS